MNKKFILKLAALLLLIITSCGGANEGDENKDSKAPTVCECMDAMNKMMEEMQVVGIDEAKVKEVEEKYKDKVEACNKLGEGLSDEEKAKLREEARNCK